MPNTTSISQMTTATSVDNGDLFEIAHPDNQSATGYASKKQSLAAIAEHVANTVTYPTLATSAKTLVGSVNEIIIPKATLLWSGNFSGEGTIVVPGLHEWLLVAYINYDDETYVLLGNPLRGGSLYGIYQSVNMAQAAYRFDRDLDWETNDKLYINDYNRGIYFNGGTTYQQSNGCPIKKIYGLIKRP